MSEIMNKCRFKDGQKVKSIFFSGEGVIATGKLGCKQITVVMENGQMAAVPWFLVEYDNRPPTKFNGALVEGTELVLLETSAKDSLVKYQQERRS